MGALLALKLGAEEILGRFHRGGTSDSMVPPDGGRVTDPRFHAVRKLSRFMAKLDTYHAPSS